MARRFMTANVWMAVGIASVLGGTAQAQNKTATMSAADKKFVMAAAQGGLAEVQLGELAAKQGSSDAVKQFGQKMVEDHGKANEDLKSVATSEGLTLPTEPNAAQKATLAKLMKLQGTAFDNAYIKEMKADHKADVNAFMKEEMHGKDTGIKSFASRTLPVVTGHYHMITEMGPEGKMSTPKKM